MPPSPVRPSSTPVSAARNRPTIADVARQAGVSKATVSRYLNRGDEQLSADIASRVAQAIAATAYQPSAMARSLKHGRTRLLGLVVADISNPFSIAVLRSAERHCQDAGYLLVLFNLDNQPGREQAAMQALLSYQVEGLILNRVDPGQTAWHEASQHGKPVVLIDRWHPQLEADFVSVDNRQVLELALQHLTQAGYRHFLLVTQPLEGVSARAERAHAFRSILQAQDLPHEVFESHANSPADLVQALQRFQHTAAPGRGAVITANAITTLGVATAAATLGWQLGEAVGFLGIDDPEWAPLVGAGLTTIAQPTEELGACAVRCLIERIEGLTLPARRILLPGELRVRHSTHPEK